MIVDSLRPLEFACLGEGGGGERGGSMERVLGASFYLRVLAWFCLSSQLSSFAVNAKGTRLSPGKR